MRAFLFAKIVDVFALQFIKISFVNIYKENQLCIKNKHDKNFVLFFIIMEVPVEASSYSYNDDDNDDDDVLYFNVETEN